MQSASAILRGLSAVRVPLCIWYASRDRPLNDGRLTSITDAIPKKRGPKTDLLESLLKRVDDLEQQLEESATVEGQTIESASDIPFDILRHDDPQDLRDSTPRFQRTHKSQLYPRHVPASDAVAQLLTFPSPVASPTQVDALLDTFFAQVHGKPFHIVDESTIRKQVLGGILPHHLTFAIYALSIGLV